MLNAIGVQSKLTYLLDILMSHCTGLRISYDVYNPILIEEQLNNPFPKQLYKMTVFDILQKSASFLSIKKVNQVFINKQILVLLCLYLLYHAYPRNHYTLHMMML